jgi:hypothetical protein
VGAAIEGAPRAIVRARAKGWFALALGLIALGCHSEVVDEATFASCAGGECGIEPACDGDSPEMFCDDCDPCTIDANCTPCSALPVEQRSMRQCTPDEELPAFCAGRTGCAHVAVTTPEGQRNACFPVKGDPELHPGTCWKGTCVEND